MCKFIPRWWVPMIFPTGTSLILGGARSGKSSFAESLAHEGGRQKIYFATCQIWEGDVEIEDRIAQHRARRGDDWQLVEEPLDLANRLPELATSENCILVDCLTLWLTNVMLAEVDIEQEIDRLVEALGSLPKDRSVLLVSNEVGQGIVPVDKMARDFRDHAGRLHQKIAASVVSENVWFVTAGLPQKLK